METVVQSASTASIPLLLGALAVLLASRAGIVNLAVEGLMLIGAFAGAWVAHSSTGGVGFLVAIAVGAVVGLGLGWVFVVMRADQVVVGVAFNIMILGLTSYLSGVLTKTSRNALDVGQPDKWAIPGLSDIPGIGPIFDMHWIAYFAFLLVPVAAYVLFRTGIGTRLRACGEYAEAARAVGIKVVRMRILVMGASGALSAAAGAFMVLGDLGVFRPYLTGGRGYIAYVVVILARYRPVGALLAAGGFGLAQALTFYIQLKGVKIPTQFILATPYVVTLLAIVMLGKRIGQPPAEEGRPLQLSR